MKLFSKRLEVFHSPLSLQPTNGGDIAQLVEQRTENPCVVGSIPTITTPPKPQPKSCGFFLPEHPQKPTKNLPSCLVYYIMADYRFTHFEAEQEGEKPFDRLLKIFLELLTYTSGDVAEALDWFKELDQEYKLTNEDYSMEDFLEELKRKGYLQEGESGEAVMTPKTEHAIRSQALETIFGKLKRGGAGEHRTHHVGQGQEASADFRPWQFGDKSEHIAFTEGLKNAQIRMGPDHFSLSEHDLEVVNSDHYTQTATVLMIDISHSMILYGEDRITPAKRVAMALVELVRRRYPKDSLDILVFGNDAWPIQAEELPYLQVGPFHTNTVAGLELALDLLRKRRHANKQIFMITDGKPTCLKEGDEYYKNSFGLDRKITNRCLDLAMQCRKLRIPVTTFMIASDPYLQEFVKEFTEVNQGRAFFSSLQGLGDMIFRDFELNKSKRTRF